VYEENWLVNARSDCHLFRKVSTLCERGALHFMGLACDKFYDFNEIQHNIQTVSRHFDLVIIVELWDESMLMLKKLLDMDMEDIIQVPDHKTQYREEISSVSRKKLEELLWPEYLIYNFFKYKLMATISKEGKYVSDGKAYIESINRRIANECSFMWGKAPQAARYFGMKRRCANKCNEFCSQVLGKRNISLIHYMQNKCT